ncbi:hypothetical protein GO988_00300 [Hymenobacter sp. HMF4947]|uniref:Uncharacterized protein n=1 Tax=Hymenobacter ginkgonis TaxID=2682976 RepID=A0A7K1T8M5_9BACT|nr:hypothetical protein [Hymenobacter ginkgonis]MVN74759.1 hypothetical protein [Hymenobacter ginkgonis]
MYRYGNVGIGTSSPTQLQEVAGQVFSSTGGFRFPDNSVQTTATTDAQQLSISGSTISLTNGGSVTVPSSADNLGNHTATRNLNLGPNLLVGNGAAAAWPSRARGGWAWAPRPRCRT